MGQILRTSGQKVVDLPTGEAVYKGDGDIAIEQQPLAGIGMGDVRELMLGNAELLCQNRPVALRLRQHHHEIAVFQNVCHGGAGQKIVG